MKDPFSDAFEAKLARMPAHVRDRVVTKNVMPSKSMERDQYVGLYAHQLKPVKVKEAKYREYDNVAGKDA